MSDPVMSDPAMGPPLTSAAAAERQADRLRGELAGTIEQLKDNLRPAQLAGEALATTRAHTPDWVVNSLAFVRSPSGLALVCAASAAVASTVANRRPRRRRPIVIDEVDRLDRH